MNMDANVWLSSVCALGQIPGLVNNLWASAKVTRFNLVTHLAFASNIVLEIKTDNESRKINSPYGWATFHPY